jgi:tetratricopeptide (TPR) repeat protein
MIKQKKLIGLHSITTGVAPVAARFSVKSGIADFLDLPLKNLLAIVTLTSLLSACAGMKQPANAQSTAENDTGTTAAQTVKRQAGARPADTSDETLPHVELSEEILFKILSSEIAFQRGQWQAAYVTLMGAAQQTRDPRLAKRAAEIAVSARSPNEALAAVRLWIELAPQSEEALQNYLGLVILTDNLAEIEPVLKQRLQTATPQARGPLMLQMQRFLGRAKDKAAAFALLEKVTAPYGDTMEAHLALAQGAAVNGDPERARQEAELAIKIKPDSELAILTLAQVTQDPKQATALIEQYLHKYPKSREVRIAYARSLVEQKQYDAARTQFERLLKDEPDDLTTLFALGLLNAQTERPKQAEQYLSKYVKQLAAHPDEDRDPTQALLVLSQLAEERNDIPAAIKWLDQIEPGEAYLSAQIRRAQLTAKNGDIAAARTLLAQTEANGESDQTRLIQAEAQILRDANQSQTAAEVLDAGLKRFPNNIDLLYDRAMAADKLEDWAGMESSLRKIMQIAPDNQHAYNALGYSLADRNIRLAEAYELISKAVSLAPEDPFIADSLGWVQFRMGNLPQAEATLTRAYALRADTEIAMHLGEVLWAQDKRDAALTVWRAALKKEPNNAALKSTLTRLKVKL